MDRTNVDIHELHGLLEGLGIPVDSVHKNKDGSIEVDYLPRATDEQRRIGNLMAWGEYDAEAEAARKAALEALPKIEDINGAKKVDDLREMALALREYLDSKGVSDADLGGGL